MGVRDCASTQTAMNMRSTFAKLGSQMLPLVEQLPFRFFDLAAEYWTRDFGSAETVPSALGVVGDAGQERGDGLNRARMRAETGELRMPGVAARFALQNFLSE